MADEAAILEPLTELLRGGDTGARCTAIFSVKERSGGLLVYWHGCLHDMRLERC
jgi:hypothetical protein